MADRIVAVFDVGKTNAKLTAFWPDLTVATQATTSNAVRRGEPYDHVDTERLFAFLIEGLAAIARMGTLTDIVPTTHGASVALVAPGALAVPIMDYEWEGIGVVDRLYDPLRPAFKETGSPALPGGQNVGRQLFYVARTLSGPFATVRAALPYPQYWGWRLTGRFAADASSLGAHTDLWAPRRREHSSLVSRLDWRWLMAPVRRADDVLGPVRSELATRYGLDPQARVRVGIHDSNASLVPFLRSHDAPFTLVSSGTWVIVFAVGGDPDALDPSRDTLLNVDVEGRPVPSARFMGGREYEIIVAGAGEGEATLADAVAVMESGAMILPSYVKGVGPFPYREPYGKDDPRIAPGPLRRAAASLYLALVLTESMAAVAADGPILVDGPLARDPVVPAALAAFSGRSVEVLAETGSTAGAARLAGLAAPIAFASVTPIKHPLIDRYRQAWRRIVG